MAAADYLVDTNILLRLFMPSHHSHALTRKVVDTLADKGLVLAYTLQNLTEFWNVCTRPTEKNGLGLTVDQTEINVREIELSFTFLPDNDSVYREWRRIVFEYKVSGVQVHDARLAASVLAHGLTRILTFNVSDFSRFSGITAIHPNSV